MIDVGTEELTGTVECVELDLKKRDTPKYEDTKLPSNKADYTRMSIAEKVRCYNLNTKGTEKAFDMVRTYFQSVGMFAGFDDIYEEAKLLTNYCERSSAEGMMNEKVEQILQKIDMWDINMKQISKYSVNILSKVFDFDDVDYYIGLKLFSAVLNRKSVSLEHQERYELFEKIYEEGMREKRQKKNRDGR